MPRFETEQDVEAWADFRAEMEQQAEAGDDVATPPRPLAYRSGERFTTLEDSAFNSDDRNR